MGLSQQSCDKACNRRVFLKMSCHGRMNPAGRSCWLPFSSPTSPVHLPSRPLSPPSMLKSLEAQMWADSGYFLSRCGSFMCHKCSIRIGQKRTGAIMNPNTLTGQEPPGPANSVVFYARLLSECLCADGGSMGLQSPARWDALCRSLFP